MAEEKEIDVKQVTRYLSRAFATATKDLGRAVRFKNDDGKWETTKLYNLQVSFTYLLDEIQRGPTCLVTHHIAKANSLIDSVKSA